MSTYAVARALTLAHNARGQGRTALLEHEGFEILQALGLSVPARLDVRHSAEVPLTPLLVSERVVVKVIAEAVAHKTEAGGVAIVRNRHDQIAAAIQRMEAAFDDVIVSGYSISECIAYDRAIGHEWLLGLRWTDEFGPILTVGVGGVAAEFLTGALRTDQGSVIVTPAASRDEIADRLRTLVLTPLVCGGLRRQPAETTLEALVASVQKFGGLSDACRPDGLTEFEVNPFVVSAGGLVALDVLARVGSRSPVSVPDRPIHKIHHLLTPRSLAVVGVSTRMNPGRIILRNLLHEGFDRASITVVKPETPEIDGCRAVPTIHDVPGTVDLAVLAVSAQQLPEAFAALVDGRKAESIIVIPGGLEEKSGTHAITSTMADALARARRTAWGGPVVNGGNCLGIQSRPGRYDTMFIPGHKLGAAHAQDTPLALISQSGAFAISRATRLAHLRPRYSITVGNQIDLTVGDYLAHLERDPDVQVFGLYVEGFKPLDGRSAVESVRRITASGRTVILYRAGRTREGAGAAASHTAAISGDYDITRGLFVQAGAIVADTLEDFTDLVMLFTMLAGRGPAGPRLGAVSNAGYECVAIADHIGTLELSGFSDAAVARAQTLLDQRGLATLVDVHNPLDVTPMADDETFAALAETIVGDPNVDVAVIGCVPATAALNTLEASPSHAEDLGATTSVATRLVQLVRSRAKPVVAVVDAGARYDAFAERLCHGGIPTFRSADRAMRLVGLWIDNRLRDRARASAERWVDEYSR